MLESMYIIFMLLGFLTFFIGLTNVIKLDRNPRIFLLIVSWLFFIILMFGAFDLETVHCGYVTNFNDTSEWNCTTHSKQEIVLVGVNILFLIINTITIFFTWLTMANNPRSEL